MITYVAKHESLRRADVYLSLSRLLLHATTLHPQANDRGTHERFKSAVAALNTRLEPCRSGDELMQVAQAFTRVVERYMRQAHGTDGAREGELTRMLSAISDTITEIDMLRKPLERSLQSAREPAETPAPPAAREPPPDVSAASQPALETPKGRDPSTGLLWRGDAVDSIFAHDAERSHLHAAVFVMDGYQAFNRCHGPTTGDRALQVLCQQLAREFQPQDRLFRWTPETLVALLVRLEAPAEVRSMVMGIALKRHEMTVQIGTRSVHIPVKCLAMAVSSASPDPADLVAKIDEFVAKRLRFNGA
ncbi:MAG: diguanylate cyclase [Bryobacterales bacterium]|nr:diguanylate cyclase [Bryobacterales bacterium]